MITRRAFTKTLGGAAALATFSPVLGWALDEPKVSADAAKLYRDSFILDGNALAWIGSLLGRSNQDDITKVIRESGVTALKSTLGGAAGDFATAVADIAAAEQLMEKRADLFLKVRTPGDFERAQKEQKLGVIYSFESANMLEDKIERIELFRGLGVRVMQLSYNRRTPFGVGCLDGETEGLTELGRKAIAKMNEIGVALDLSHSNTQDHRGGHRGLDETAAHYSRRLPRCLYASAQQGGSGIEGAGRQGRCRWHLHAAVHNASPKQPMLDDYMKHLEHALKICGEDHVGVGSDVPFFRVDDSDLEEMKKATEKRKADGIAAPGEDRPTYIPDLNTPRKMEFIADALLKRGHKSGVVEKIMGANFKRVFGEIWIT